MPVNAPAGFVGSAKLSNNKMNINFGLRSGAGATGFSFFKLGAWAGGRAGARARARSSTARPACRTYPAKHAHTDTHAPLLVSQTSRSSPSTPSLRPSLGSWRTARSPPSSTLPPAGPAWF